MPWTIKQRSLAIVACRVAGIGEERRTGLILRSFPNAHHRGDITSTAPRLNSSDFEAFMAIVEGYAGGKVCCFPEGYWRRCADDRLSRMRRKALAIAAELEKACKLAPGGAGLEGWIEKRVSGGATRQIEELDFPRMQALILQLQAYARQNGVGRGGDGKASVAMAS